MGCISLVTESIRIYPPGADRIVRTLRAAVRPAPSYIRSLSGSLQLDAWQRDAQ